MYRQIAGLVLACGIATGAHAEEGDPVEKQGEANWSISLSGGSVLIDRQGDQSFFRLGGTRILGDAYVRAALARFSTREGPGLVSLVPATTWQASLGGGYRFGALTVDGYGAVGWRKFSRETYRRRRGMDITIDGHGKTLSGGISATYQHALDDRSVLAPFAALDLNRIDTARAIEVAGRGTIAHREHQSGTTGSFGLTIDRLVGRDARHRFEIYAAAVTSSNSAVAMRSTPPLAAARLFGPLDIPGAKDSWGEFGAGGSLGLSKSVYLDVSVVRTSGFRGAESTSVLGGLRHRF